MSLYVGVTAQQGRTPPKTNTNKNLTCIQTCQEPLLMHVRIRFNTLKTVPERNTQKFIDPKVSL